MILMHLLWTEGTDRVLRNRLNQTLYQLKQSLEGLPVIRYARKRYLLNSAVVQTDVAQFRFLLSNRCFHESAEFLQAGFLSQLQRTFSRDFERWVQETEARLMREFATAAVEAWESYWDSGAWGSAAESATVLCSVLPRNQQYLRMALRSYAAMGQLARARTFFDQHCAGLQAQDPAWQPDSETVELSSQLGSIARRGIGQATNNTEEDHVPPFVGRSGEIRRLQALLTTPPQQGVQCVIITGPRGSGKTRLLNETILASVSGNTALVATSAKEETSRIPYATLYSLFESRYLSLLLPHESPIALSPLTPLHSTNASFPGILTPLQASFPNPGLLLRLRMRQWINEKMDQGKHVIFVIDDAEWLDSYTAGVLAPLLTEWKQGGVSIVFTARDRNRIPLPSLFTNPFRSTSGSCEIQIDPLSGDNIDDLIEHYVVRRASVTPSNLEEVRRVVSTVLRLVQGDLHQLLYFLSDLLITEQSAGEKLPTIQFAGALRRIVASCVEQLPALARRVVQHCTCLNRAVSIPELARVIGMDDFAIARTASDLVSAGLMCWHEDQVIIASPALRDCLYELIEKPMRVVLHQRIADGLIAGGASDDLPEIANHLLSAGRMEDVSAIALRAADTAQRKGAICDAIQILRAASLSDRDADTCLQGLLRLGELLSLVGETTEAETVLRRAQREAQGLGDLLSEQRARVGRLQLRVAGFSVIQDTTLDELETLKREVLSTQTFALLPRLFELELRAQARQGNHPMVRRVLDQLQDVQETVSPPVARQLRSLGSLGSIYGDTRAGRALAHQVLKGLGEGENPDLELRALNWLVITGIQEGTLQSPEGMSLRRRAARVAHRSTEVLERTKLASNTAVWYLDIGDLEGAEVALARANTIAGQYCIPELHANLLANRGELALCRRQPREAKKHFKRVTEMTTNHPAQPANLYAQAGLMLADLTSGQKRDTLPLESLPSHPPFDFSLLAVAQSRLFRAQGQKAQAVQVLVDAATDLRHRFKLGWVRLILEAVKFESDLALPIEEAEEFLARRHLNELLRRLHSGRRV